MDAMPESGEKIRLHKKSERPGRSTEIMKKYYTDPEKQARLLERIKEYEEKSELYKLKAIELKKFILQKDETQ